MKTYLALGRNARLAILAPDEHAEVYRLDVFVMAPQLRVVRPKNLDCDDSWGKN
ncbi:MAG: hypothetical protein WAM71_03035 [Candidatus Korobacteraceae bacterium]